MKHNLNSILLVDDDLVATYIHSEIIASINLTDNIHVVKEGKEALEFVEDHKQDPSIFPLLILLDLNMPGMDGFEFLEKLQDMRDGGLRDIYVVVISSSSHTKDIQKSKKYPIN